jgi:hypothetical protein
MKKPKNDKPGERRDPRYVKGNVANTSAPATNPAAHNRTKAARAAGGLNLWLAPLVRASDPTAAVRVLMSVPTLF